MTIVTRHAREWHSHLVLGLLVAAVFADVLFLGSAFFLRDVPRLYVPGDRVLHDVVAGGELPAWNPRWDGGQPLAADPGFNAFYPIHLLLFLAPFARAFLLQIVVQYFIAASGMFALLRFFETSRFGAMFGAVAYAFGGMLTSYSNLVPFLYSAALLPWVVLSFCRFIDSRRANTFVVAVLALGAYLLIGEQSMVFQAGALLAACAFARTRGIVTPLRLTTLVIVCAIGVAAIQIVPAFDFQRDTARGDGLPYAMTTLWSMPAGRPLELIFPDLFGRLAPMELRFWGDRFFPWLALPFIFNIYAGLAAAVFIIAGLARRARGWMFVSVIAAASYLTALGAHGPVFPLLYAAGMHSLRFPEKFFTAAIFVLTGFAGTIAGQVVEDEALRKTATIVSAIIAAVAAIVWALTFTEIGRIAFDAIFRHGTAPLADARLGWARAALIAIALTLILALVRRPIPFITALSFFIVADLLTRAGGTAQRIDADYLTPPPLARQLAATQMPVRIYNDKEWLMQLERSKQPPLPFEGKVWSVRNGLMPMSASTWGFEGMIEPDIPETFLRRSKDFTNLFGEMRRTGRSDRTALLLHLAGVTHVAAERVVDPAANDFRDAQPVTPIPIGAPRAYFATQLVAAPDLDSMYALLKTVTPFQRDVAFIGGTPFAPAAGTILSFSQTANTITADVDSGGRSFLAIAVTAHRYWTAAIDGQATTIVPTNLAFQGVVVERGRHRVTLRYSNTVLNASAFVSMIAIFALLIAPAAAAAAGRRK